MIVPKTWKDFIMLTRDFLRIMKACKASSFLNTKAISTDLSILNSIGCFLVLTLGLFCSIIPYPTDWNFGCYNCTGKL